MFQKCQDFHKSLLEHCPNEPSVLQPLSPLALTFMAKVLSWGPKLYWLHFSDHLVAAVSLFGWCNSLWSRNTSVGPQAQVLTPIQVSRWQHIRRAFSWAAFLRTVAIIDLSFLCCCCLFTGIDYLHPDLASNYVSTSQPVLGNTYVLNVLASLVIRNTHAHMCTHACMHIGHAHTCTLELPILMEPQLRPKTNRQGMGPGSRKSW